MDIEFLYRELKYVLEDSQASVVLSSPDYTDRIGSLAHSLGIHHQPLGEQARLACKQDSNASSIISSMKASNVRFKSSRAVLLFLRSLPFCLLGSDLMPQVGAKMPDRMHTLGG